MLIDLVYVADSCLVASEKHEDSAGDENYFFDLKHEDGFELVTVEVDSIFGEKLLSLDENFKDGYDAANEVARVCSAMEQAKKFPC